MIVMSDGGGTNSMAMLIGLRDSGIRPDLIVFADTGGERPHTYRYMDIKREWLAKNGFPDLTVVRKVDAAGNVQTLEQSLLDSGYLPSIAYGFKTCSQKFKIQPVDKFLNSNEMANKAWSSGGKVTKLIGYDADETHRIRDYDDKKYDVRYPLVDWGWGRDDCIAAIRNEGLPLPGKSSCFFCPNMRKGEIMELHALHPDLAARAIAIEDNADKTSVPGLGRSFSWRSLLATPDMFSDLYDSPMPCGCYDGESVERYNDERSKCLAKSVDNER